MMIYQLSRAVLKGSAMAYLPKTVTSCILVSGTLAMTSMPAFAQCRTRNLYFLLRHRAAVSAED